MNLRTLPLSPSLRKQTNKQGKKSVVSVRKRQDTRARNAFFLLTLFPILLVAVIIVALLVRAWPILSTYSLSELVLGEVWRPNQGQFGFYPFLANDPKWGLV